MAAAEEEVGRLNRAAMGLLVVVAVVATCPLAHAVITRGLTSVRTGSRSCRCNQEVGTVLEEVEVAIRRIPEGVVMAVGVMLM